MSKAGELLGYDRTFSTRGALTRAFGKLFPSASPEAIKTVGSDAEANLEALLTLWSKAAVEKAVVRSIQDPEGYIATVAGARGAWAFGETEAEALTEMESVLYGWAEVKTEDGDDDIPIMGEVDLTVRR